MKPSRIIHWASDPSQANRKTSCSGTFGFVRFQSEFKLLVVQTPFNVLRYLGIQTLSDKPWETKSPTSVEVNFTPRAIYSNQHIAIRENSNLYLVLSISVEKKIYTDIHMICICISICIHLFPGYTIRQTLGNKITNINWSQYHTKSNAFDSAHCSYWKIRISM